MNVLKTRYRTPTGDALDNAMSLGITAAMVVMSRSFGWGKKRLLRLQAATVEFLQQELLPRGEKYTQQYRDELAYALARMQEALTERMK